MVLLSLALLLTLTAYTLSGGADYGGGLWDLLATGPTADRQRTTIAHAVGPVWEANHVWLIVAIVILFAGFPRAYAAVSTYLHVPLVLVLVGIVLRGSAFVFRAYGPDDPRHVRFWGRVFAMASTATPFFLAGELMFPVAPTLDWLMRIGKVRIVIAKATIARQHIRQTLFK